MKKNIVGLIVLLVLTTATVFAAGSDITRDDQSGTIYGQTTVYGHAVREVEELFGDTYEIVYFKIYTAGDINLITILADLYAEGSTYVDYDGEYYLLKTGCLDKTTQEVGSPEFTIDGDEYWALTTSKEGTPAFLTLDFGDLIDTGGACITPMTDVTVTTWDGFPYGEYTVYGHYYTVEEMLFDEMTTTGHMVMTGYDDPVLGAYLDSQISEGNSVNGMTDDGYYQMAIGCDTGNSLETYWYVLDGLDYEALTGSRAENPLTFNITMGALPEIGGPCISHINNIEIVGYGEGNGNGNGGGDVPPENGVFPDVDPDHENVDAIENIESLGIISGYPDGTFRPNGEINRAELTRMVVEMIFGDPDPDVYKNCFPDVLDEWFAPYVCYALEQEWIHGYPDGSFSPASNTNRAEAIKIILNAFYDGAANIPAYSDNEDQNYLHFMDLPYYAQDDEDKPWFYDFATYSILNDLLDYQHLISIPDSDAKMYLFNANMTRKEVAETIYRLMNL